MQSQHFIIRRRMGKVMSSSCHINAQMSLVMLRCWTLSSLFDRSVWKWFVSSTLFPIDRAQHVQLRGWNALTECERKCRLYLREIKEGWLTEENVSQVNSSTGQHFNLVFTEMVTSQKLTKVPACGRKGKVWGTDQGKGSSGKNTLFPHCATAS